MRVFVAVELPEKIKEKIDHECRILRVGRVPIRWVEKQNLHITVAFIGDVEEEKIAVINGAVAEAIHDFSFVGLLIEKPVFLPVYGKPYVIAFNLAGEADRFSFLCDKIYENLMSRGFLLERNKSGHLTIGRIKKPLKRNEKESLEEKFESLALNIPIEVLGVTLFESKTFKEGPVYKRIMTYEL